MTGIDFKFITLMNVVDKLHQGERLILHNGQRIAMGIDYSIGYVMTNVKTKEESIAGNVDLSMLRKLIDESGISYVTKDNDNGDN